MRDMFSASRIWHLLEHRGLGNGTSHRSNFSSFGLYMHDYPLITDLALILIAAGCTSVICRMLKLPILVGYLLAGVLTGPHIALIPDVHDVNSIHTWSEIGVIFLLFALGLEFNFKNLLKVGKTGAIAVGTIVGGMMASCIGLGHLLGWSLVMSIFMGGILCISSTMVIVKAFEELKLKGKPFTHIVYGIEIIEDIVGILLMVILSTIAMSQSANIVQEISTTALRVVFFLVLWFVGGIFIVPTLLRKLKPWLTDEILLTISLALCLGMVMLADTSNLSTALGAFTIGSILGATTEAHRIETMMTPIKNLFGAIFFVSVGMMVNPGAIVENLGTLFILLALELVMNPILGAFGIFISGKSLRESIHAGACFGQIGEFSFIIANLGVSLAVLDEFTYPVVITISAITMITTPYVIRFSDRLVEPVSKLLPERLRHRVDEERSSSEKTPNRRMVIIRQFVVETFILSMVLLGIVSFLGGFVEPNLRGFLASHWSDMDAPFVSECIGIGATLLAMMPFLSALILRRNKLNRAFTIVLLRGNGERLLRTLQLIRVVVVGCFIAFALLTHSPFVWYVNLCIGAAVLFIVARFEIVFSNYMRLERQFLLNYNEVELNEQDEACETADNLGSMTDIAAGNWLSADLSVANYTLDEDSPFVDKTLIELNLRALHNLFIIRIERAEGAVNIPSGREKLHLGDTVHIVGHASSLRVLEQPPYGISSRKLHLMSMRQFSRELQERRTDAAMLRCLCIPIHGKSGLAGQTLRTSGIGSKNKCLVIGIEICGRVDMNPSPEAVFVPNSRLWVIGESDTLAALLEENLITAPSGF